MQTLEIETPHGLARAAVAVPDGAPRAALLLGHGAGGSIDAPDIAAAMEVALDLGVTVARIEQPYRVAGRRSPSPARQLDAAWTTVVRHLEGDVASERPLIVGGRSSGARVACRTADACGAVGVLCLAFPLQPAARSGKPPAASRIGELDAVTVPTLVVQGVKDPFGMPPEAPNRTVAQVAGDHSMRPGIADARVAVRDWLTELLAGLPHRHGA